MITEGVDANVILKHYMEGDGVPRAVLLASLLLFSGRRREAIRESSFGLWFFQLFSSLRCVPGMICASSSCLLSRDHVSVLSEYPVPVVSVL